MKQMTSSELKDKIYQLLSHGYAGEYIDFLLKLIDGAGDQEYKAIHYKYLTVVTEYNKEYPGKNMIADTDLPCLLAINFILNVKGNPKEKVFRDYYRSKNGCSPEDMLKRSKGKIITRHIERLKQDNLI